MDLNNLNFLSKVSSFVQILAIILVFLGGALQLSRHYLEKKINKIKTQTDHTERLKAKETISKLETTIFQQSQHIEQIDYKEMSEYDCTGNKSGKVGTIPMVRTPINDWNEDFVTRNQGKIVCKCNASAIEQCKSVIKKLPIYPFSYYFLATCLKEVKNRSWRQYANKAKSILEKTTKIPGHHSDHDLILDEVDKLLLESRD